MAQAYSPGLSVTDNIVLAKQRILPLKGNVLVKKGDKVKAEDLVAETFLPGNVLPINLANKLGVTANLVIEYLKVQPGQIIKKGDILAENKGLFGLGLFKSRVVSPIDGEVESISQHTGQALLREPRIPVQIKAFIDGIVVDVIPEEGVVIENKSAYIQGIFGISGEVTGELKMLVNDPNDVLTESLIDSSCKDKCIVGGSMVTLKAIQKAIEVGVKGIICGGIDDQDIKALLGYDIGVAITGHEHLGVSILITEGFGKIKMANKTFDLLKRFEGKKTSMHGKTQIRAGVIRPEVIIPLEFNDADLVASESHIPMLEEGTIIRVIRQPNFGVIGKVTGLPEELHTVESETRVRILEAELENGKKTTIPRANVEVIET
ncbi:MAG TPA: hypothetical protein PKZ69_05445 [Candidatus Cloacimonadota bacterium]|nr:hypothetical protein [Candidatus Cloacimonadota bacterium]